MIANFHGGDHADRSCFRLGGAGRNDDVGDGVAELRPRPIPGIELGQYIDLDGDDILHGAPEQRGSARRSQSLHRDPGGTANLYGSRAFIHRLMGNYPLADADATRRIEIDPSANAYRNRGIIRQNAGRHEEAVADFHVSFRRGYNRPAVVHKDMAASLRQLGRYSEALAAVDVSASLDPAYEWALYERGRIFTDQERWDEAIGAWTRYIALNGSNVDAYIYRSTAFTRLERWNDALADADRTILTQSSQRRRRQQSRLCASQSRPIQ